jgi:hypothetical protein
MQSILRDVNVTLRLNKESEVMRSSSKFLYKKILNINEQLLLVSTLLLHAQQN